MPQCVMKLTTTFLSLQCCDTHQVHAVKPWLEDMKTERQGKLAGLLLPASAMPSNLLHGVSMCQLEQEVCLTCLELAVL